MNTTFTTSIDAPPAKVFKWIYDKDLNLQWLPNLIEAEVLQACPGGVGSTFRQVYLENGRRMEMTGTVTAYEQDRYLACAISSSAFDLNVDYRLEDRSGRTHLTQNSDIRFKGFAMKLFGALLKPLMRKMTVKNYADAFAKLKACIATDAD